MKPLPSNVKAARPPAVPDGGASIIGASLNILAHCEWHRVAWATCNNYVSANCRTCRSASIVVDTVQLDSELAPKRKSRIDEDVKKNLMTSTSWTFVSSSLPPPSAIDHYLICFILSLDHRIRDPSPPPLPNHVNTHRDDSPYFQMSDFSLSPVLLPDPLLRSPSVRNGLRIQISATQFDLNSAFRGLTLNGECAQQPLAQDVLSLDDSQLNKASMINAPTSMLAQADGSLGTDQQQPPSPLRLGLFYPVAHLCCT